jgi:hypothetical protein
VKDFEKRQKFCVHLYNESALDENTTKLKIMSFFGEHQWTSGSEFVGGEPWLTVGGYNQDDLVRLYRELGVGQKQPQRCIGALLRLSEIINKMKAKSRAIR